MEWFRLYGEFATDPKVQSMPEVMQRRLLMLFCLTCNETLHTLKDEEIAFALRISEDELADTKQLFMKKNFVDDSWAIVKWDVRQMPSDVSKGRVAKYRANRKALGLSSNGYTKHSALCYVTVTLVCTANRLKISVSITHTPLRSVGTTMSRTWSALVRHATAVRLVGLLAKLGLHSRTKGLNPSGMVGWNIGV